MLYAVVVAQVIFYDQFRQVERLLIGQPLAVDDRSTSGVIKATVRARARASPQILLHALMEVKTRPQSPQRKLASTSLKLKPRLQLLQKKNYKKIR